MKVTVKDLLKALLEKCDLEAEVKVFSKDANKLNKDGKEIDLFCIKYDDNGYFSIDVIE